MYTKEDFLEMLKSIDINVDDSIFSNETEEIYKELISLERKYSVNTKSIVKSFDLIDIPKSVKVQWKDLYDDFILYDGNAKSIDTIEKSVENYSLNIDGYLNNHVIKESNINDQFQKTLKKVDQSVHFSFCNYFF